MKSETSFTLTILDLPEIREILQEAIDAVPDWERAQLRDRLLAVVQRAQAERDQKAREWRDRALAAARIARPQEDGA